MSRDRRGSARLPRAHAPRRPADDRAVGDRRAPPADAPGPRVGRLRHGEPARDPLRGPRDGHLGPPGRGAALDACGARSAGRTRLLVVDSRRAGASGPRSTRRQAGVRGRPPADGRRLRRLDLAHDREVAVRPGAVARHVVLDLACRPVEPGEPERRVELAVREELAPQPVEVGAHRRVTGVRRTPRPAGRGSPRAAPRRSPRGTSTPRRSSDRRRGWPRRARAPPTSGDRARTLPKR